MLSVSKFRSNVLPDVWLFMITHFQKIANAVIMIRDFYLQQFMVFRYKFEEEKKNKQ